MELVDEADKDKNGKIDFDEWKFMGNLRLYFGCARSVSTDLALLDS